MLVYTSVGLNDTLAQFFIESRKVVLAVSGEFTYEYVLGSSIFGETIYRISAKLSQ